MVKMHNSLTCDFKKLLKTKETSYYVALVVNNIAVDPLFDTIHDTKLNESIYFCPKRNISAYL